MIISIPQETFSSLLAKAQSILERKTTRPVLEYILLQAFDGQLQVSATDLRVSLVQTTDCAVEVPGSIAVPGRKIHEIVREMPKMEIRLETKESGWVTVSAEKSVFHLPGLPAEEFPSLPSPPASFSSFAATTFSSMLDKTLFASSNDESRIYLCGVFMKSFLGEGGDQQMRMVATDGHRLSLSEHPMSGDLDPFDNGIIMPKKGLTELRAMIDGSGSEFEMAASEGQIFARVDGTLLSVTLIDASFPNYEQVIPEEAEHKVAVNRRDFLDALRRVSLLSDQETHTVIMETDGEGTVLSSTTAALGDAREDIVSEYPGEPVRVAFNSVYLMEAVRSMTGEQLLLSISDALAPCLLRSPSDPGHLCVVMPMRIE